MQIALRNHQKPITIWAHGVLDYLYGVLLVLAPWMFQFSADTVPMQVAISFGCSVLLLSAITRYPLGLAPIVPFRAHLWLDVLTGIALAAIAWTMPAYSHRPRLILFTFGFAAIVVPLLTRRAHPNLPS